MIEHPLAYALTFPASSLFWWFFEYLNRFVWNWYYLGIDDMGAGEYAFYATICFASVLPAVYVTAEVLGTFRFFDDRLYDDMGWRPNVRSWPSCLVLAALSLVGLTGIVLLPEYTYPLLWISPLMVFVLVQVLLGEASVLVQLKRGSWGQIFRFEVRKGHDYHRLRTHARRYEKLAFHGANHHKIEANHGVRMRWRKRQIKARSNGQNRVRIQ